MPMLSHEQIHRLLVGVATIQKVNGDVFAQTEYTEHSRFNHGHYVAALHEIAGTGDPADVQQLLLVSRSERSRRDAGVAHIVLVAVPVRDREGREGAAALEHRA